MRSKTLCSENLDYIQAQALYNFDSPNLYKKQNNLQKYHKSSRSEDFQLLQIYGSALSKNQNTLKLTQVKSQKLSNTPKSNLDINTSKLQVSSLSLNYSSVHELSILLEQERDQNHKLEQKLIQIESLSHENLLQEKNLIISQQSLQIVALKDVVKQLQFQQKRQLTLGKQVYSFKDLDHLEYQNSHLLLKQPLLDRPNNQSHVGQYQQVLKKLKQYENFVQQILDEQGWKQEKENALENLDKILAKFHQLHQEEKEQAKFVQCIKDLISSCAPKNYFGNNKPNLKQVWKYLKSMLNECISLKNENIRYQVYLLTLLPGHPSVACKQLANQGSITSFVEEE